MGASSELSSRGENKRARRILADALSEGFGRADLIERMDWACLMPELVEDIAGRLLALDVAEYLRLRAACKRWRQGTVGPRDGLDSRFRPRNWIVLSHSAAGTTRRRLLNTATAARADVDLSALSTHHHLGSVDGLLVLCDRATEAVRLLNPLTGALTDFPPITAWVSVRPRRTSPGSLPRPSWCTDVVDPSVLNGAGIDDSTSPPTLFLCLRGRVRLIVFARPGDRHWVSVGPYDFYGQVVYRSLLSRRGCTYFTRPEGSIWAVDFQLPEPWLDFVVNQETVSDNTFVSSYLVPSHDARDGMLVVRCIANVKAYKTIDDRPLPLTSEVFKSKGIRRCIEVLEVDLAAQRLVPVRSVGRRAVFVGQTHCLLVSTEIFPSLAPNAVYLSRYLQELFGVSMYYLDPESNRGRLTEPMQEFDVGEDYVHVSPLHRPCSLADYLVCYVDRVRMLYD